MDRLNILEYHEPRFAEAVRIEQARIEATPVWKRRIGIGMIDDVIDATVLAYTAMLGSIHGFLQLGGEIDEAGLPKEIVYYEEAE